MSITVEYYFRSSLPLAELAEGLNEPLGCRLTPFRYDAEDYFTRMLGMELSLEPYEEENDGELEFEAYNYAVSFRTSGVGGQFRPIQLPAMLTVVRVLQELFGYAGMLVYNLQTLLAKYDQQTFVDTLSGTAIGDFPAHLAAVMRRLPLGHDLLGRPRVT